MQEFVVLVDKNDNQIGVEEKLLVHKAGMRHRAISVLVFNSEGKLLIQQRAKDKYHCPLLWANTCCTHPRDREENKVAARRRLQEEMGIDAKVFESFTFSYCYQFSNGLIENEIDHVFTATSDALPVINKDEVNDYKYMYIEEILNDDRCTPGKYAPWFMLILDEMHDKSLED